MTFSLSYPIMILMHREFLIYYKLANYYNLNLKYLYIVPTFQNILIFLSTFTQNCYMSGFARNIQHNWIN